METKSGEMKDQMYDWLLKEISSAQAMGISVAVDGKIYSLSDAQELQGVMENSYYMKSYIGDNSGKIVQINFDHITSV